MLSRLSALLSLRRMIRLDFAKSRRVSSSLSSSEELDEEEEEEEESSEDLDWTMMCFLRSLLLRCFFLLLLFLDDDLLWREGDVTSSVVQASEKFFWRRWMNCSPSVPKSCAGPELRLRAVLLPRLRRLLLRLRRWESDSSEEELLPPLLLEGDESSEEDNSDITVACPFFLYLTVLRVDLLLPDDVERGAAAATFAACRGRLMLRLLRTGATLALRPSFSSRGAVDLARLRLRPRLRDRLRLRPRSLLGSAS